MVNDLAQDNNVSELIHDTNDTVDFGTLISLCMPHDIDKQEKDIICTAVALMNKNEVVRIPWNRLYKYDMGPQNATFIFVLPEEWGADGGDFYFHCCNIAMLSSFRHCHYGSTFNTTVETRDSTTFPVVRCHKYRQQPIIKAEIEAIPVKDVIGERRFMKEVKCLVALQPINGYADWSDNKRQARKRWGIRRKTSESSGSKFTTMVII